MPTTDAPSVGALHDPGKRALTIERHARRAAEREAAELRAQLATAVDLTASLTDQAAILRDRAKTAEARVLQVEVAAAKGLPIGLAERLRGNTAEELAADADHLLRVRQEMRR